MRSIQAMTRELIDRIPAHLLSESDDPAQIAEARRSFCAVIDICRTVQRRIRTEHASENTTGKEESPSKTDESTR